MSAKPAVSESTARNLGEGLFEQMSRQHVDMTDMLWLIRNGASMTITDKNGLTPLLRAMSWGNRVLIGEMLDYGADINYAGGAQGVTAMQIAASGCDADFVSDMLKRGGDVLKKNATGSSALDIARRHDVAEVLALIEEKAAAQQAAMDAAESHRKALNAGMPVEKPFSPMKPLALRRRSP